jgi:monoamine oxidase
MAKTPLFQLLRRIAGELARARVNARVADSANPRLGSGRSAGAVRITRRTWVQAGLSAATVACSDDGDSPIAPDDGGSTRDDSSVAAIDGGADAADGSTAAGRIVVVGAGLAGLHAAWRLEQAGLDVQVYESSKRIGGRMYTGRGLFPNDQTCELGGELIDTNHRYMFALSSELELELVDRFAGDYADVVRDTWVVDGAIVSEEEITRQFSEVAVAFADAMTAADEDEAAFEELDNTPLGDWVDEVCPAADYPELNAILKAAYRGEFGLEPNEQSALNLIYLIGSDEPEPFRIFGESDERYHVKGGNDLVASGIAEKLETPVFTQHKLVRAGEKGGGYELTFDVDGEEKVVACERVVFALPFSTLRDVDIDELGLSEEKLTIIRELGYGTNAKIMGGFSSRVWLESEASGSITANTDIQQTWDSTIGQEGDTGILTNFVGGDRGIASGEGTEDDWYNQILHELDGIYPGAFDAYVQGSAVRMHWPTQVHTKGSYTCYKPGQWAFWGLEGLPEGKLHFCGEHTSPEFQGWMEGAAETGGRVAVEILKELGLPLPAGLAAVVDELTALPGQMLLRARFPKRRERLTQALGL